MINMFKYIKVFIFPTIIACFIFLSLGCSIKDNYAERVDKADKAMEKIVKENKWSFETRKVEDNNPSLRNGTTTNFFFTHWEAERPILVIFSFDNFCNLSNEIDKWVPLLFSAKACISSIITYLTSVNFSLNFTVDNNIANVSGVQTNICGGIFNIFCLSEGDVSPVLTVTLMSNFFLDNFSISFNGLCKLISTSLESALSGFM